MATLVLTAVGNAMGGPLGAALGGIVGQSIDQRLLGNGMRKGPRLGDLSVQTSSYGSSIPRLYGTMRVAGTVVWATDLKEEEAIEGGGKGSPGAVAYRYSVSLAVALSSRPMKSVRRIWADGKLIRGAAGDFKVRTIFRLAVGDEDQPVDPMIASAETIDRTTAFRGLALAIFEDLDLGEFGNRIPVLTFEVEADEEAVPLDLLLRDASKGIIDADSEQPIHGYAAHGDSIADAIADLVEVFNVDLREESGRLRSPNGAQPLEITALELGCGAEDRQVAAMARSRGSSADMPATLTISYYDPARDYQTGQMRVSSGEGGAREERLALAAVIDGSSAKRLAEQALARRWSASDRLRISLAPGRMALKPGDRLRIPGSTINWSLRKMTIDAMTVIVEAEPVLPGSGDLPADPGRPVSEPDIPIGRTELLLIEPPALGDEEEGELLAFVAGSNIGAWKPVGIETFVGAEPLGLTSLPRKSVMGRAETALAGGSSMLIDMKNEVVIALTDPAQQLRNADDQALRAGANLALIGDELIQFARADPISSGVYRLSKLLRGLRGTEWASDGHSIGDSFCLIDLAAIRAIELSRSSVGAVLGALGHGVADVAPWPRADLLLRGEAMRPLSPCHLEIARQSGGFRLAWTRRSRRGWAWLDGVDVPADDFVERYRVTVRGPSGIVEAETGDRSYFIPESQLPAMPGDQLMISVSQMGPFLPSHAASSLQIA